MLFMSEISDHDNIIFVSCEKFGFDGTNEPHREQQKTKLEKNFTT